MSGWKEIVANVAPTIGTLISGGNPLVGMAINALSKKLLGKEDGTEEEISQVLSSPNPEILARIKEAEKELKLGLANAGVKLEEIGAADRASARTRETQTGDKTTQRLAWLYTIGYFAALWAVWKFGMPEDMKEVLIGLLGVLTAAQGAIMQYYFGSSSGSRANQEALATIAKN